MDTLEAVAAIAQTVVQNDAEMLLVFVVASISQGKGQPWNYSQSLIDGGNCRLTSQTKPRIWTDETILRFTNGNDSAEIGQSTGDDGWSRTGIQFATLDRVASGRFRPEAPTDPYVLALEHTVLQIMGSLPSGTQRGYPFLFR